MFARYEFSGQRMNETEKEERGGKTNIQVARSFWHPRFWWNDESYALACCCQKVTDTKNNLIVGSSRWIAGVPTDARISRLLIGVRTNRPWIRFWNITKAFENMHESTPNWQRERPVSRSDELLDNIGRDDLLKSPNENDQKRSGQRVFYWVLHCRTLLETRK